MATIWKGTLSIGLVTVPVELKRAIRNEERIHFHMLHEADLAPIRYERICTKDDAVVPWDDIVKGYEYRKGEYVVITDDDFKSAALSASSTIALREFVPADSIDPRYFDTPYFLVPGKGGEMAYAVMRQAIADTETIGLGTLVMHQREHVAGLKAVGDALVLELMRFADELVEESDYKFPTKREVRAPELAMAKQLIDGLKAEFHPEEYRDQYHANLMKIIRAKTKGKHASLEEPERVKGDAKVVDLMERLQQSLSAGKRGKTATHRARSGTTRRPTRARTRTARSA
ncbi:MAG TPA: Ku protein [Gemmatimonadaceae bacterium]|nr:Ku protein [Gemmatimonadaceae bacterium]